jgi:integrase/recombinase XerC
MLDVADFSRNPYGHEFGRYGVLEVRYGKAKKGSLPQRRSVLTVWPWAAEIVDQWISEVRPLLAAEGNPALRPPERGQRIGLQRIDSRLAAYRDEFGLRPALDFHSMRRSMVMHPTEAGMDPLFVQRQAGHDHASTTAIYACVSSDFRVRTLRRALDQTMQAALYAGRRAQ